MAYEEYGMWEILDVLRRIHGGEGKRAVARNTGRSRKTVKRYVEAAQELGWIPGVHDPDEALAAEVLAGLRPGPRDTEPWAVETALFPHEQKLREWLALDDPLKEGLTLTKVHALLRRSNVTVSYSGLYRYVVQRLGFKSKTATVRMADVAPGELAEVDFGRLGLVWDPEKGKLRLLYALVVTLVYSRHQYVHVTHHQKIGDLIAGLEDAWEFFGGVPSRVVLDNLKAAIDKADRYDPVIQRTFNEYAEYRGFVVDAAVARSPKHKPHVERQVPYVRKNFFQGEQFLDCAHVQREAVNWCLKTAGVRIHGTTRLHPLAEFISKEKPALKELQKERFDTPIWATPKVHPDCHVRFSHALYSVPYRYRGAQTDLRADKKLVRIYVKGELVKTHARQPPGKRSTDFEDYPAEKSPYAMRDAAGLIRRAQQHGEHLGSFAQKLLSGDFPWANLRQAFKLLRLTDKYGPKVVEDACQRALRFELINVKRLEGIIRQALERQTAPQPMADFPDNVIQLPLRFLRQATTFTHQPRKENV